MRLATRLDGGARGCFIAVCLAAVIAPQVAPGDELELVSGRRYVGTLIERTDKHVVFEALLGGGTATLSFPASKVRSLTRGPLTQPAKRPPKVTPGPLTQPAKRPPKPTPTKPPVVHPPPGPRARTKREIDAVIDRAGKTLPDWWDSVALDYPKTLDLEGTRRVKGWAPNVNLGAHWFSVISPNPSRWRYGVKLCEHVVKVRRKARSPGQREAVSLLARSYVRLLKDWARGAYWYRQLVTRGARVNAGVITDLAECYWRLGGKAAAKDLLTRYRVAAPGAVHLWADMGYFDKALAVAEKLSRVRPAWGYVAAGNICRQAGKLDKALAYYQKVLALPEAPRDRRFRQMARAAAESIQLYRALDLGRLADGQYEGVSTGFRGPVQVRVTIEGGRITAVKIARHREDMPLTSMTDIPASIVTRQGLRGVDAVTGATVTSEAIINASAKALSGAPK